MKYLSECLWTHSWDVGTHVPSISKILSLISNISVLPGFNLLHLNTIVSLVGHLLRPLVLLILNTLMPELTEFFCDDMTGGEWLNICRYCGSWWNSHIDVHRLWFLNQGNSIWKAYVVRMQFLLYAIFFTQFPHKPHLIDLVQHYSTKSKTKEIKEISGGEKMEVL